MASINVLNTAQANIEAPVEIQLSLGNPIYRGPQGHTPVKGVDYFTQEDIDAIVAQVNIDDIALDNYATKEYVDGALRDVVITETDPTVPAWAKAASKPTYTAAEVGALPDTTVIPAVPADVSAFNNDAGYLTEHQSLNDYATKNYVEQIIAGVETGLLKRAVVATLPSSGIDENTIYMVERTNSETNNIYDEYLYLNNNWEKIGSTEVDLTDYLKKTDLTFTDGLTDSNGVISWDLFNTIRSGEGEKSILENSASLAGTNSHAEGQGTKAGGSNAHAEGALSQAMSYEAHAEGYNTRAEGSSSHAEGTQSIARGGSSHAEGQSTKALGTSSHAEGFSTTAQGNYSHAEGMNTIAQRNSQHVFGGYNVADNVGQNGTYYGQFIEIVGNGTYDTRSNARALGWNGNEYLSGNLYVGCADYSTDTNGLIAANAGGNKVATETYVDTHISTNLQYLTNTDILNIWNEN